VTDSDPGRLGAILKARRRQRQLSLRDLSALIDVSFNTLSRVERGHVPDLANFNRILDWLDLPAEQFLDEPSRSTTPEAIARHLRADPRLSREAVTQIAKTVEEMYHSLIAEQAPMALHLRSARTFTPAAGILLSEVLAEMQEALREEITG
jgi:transcriptional regulator with XRE-family HTH domain